MSFYFSANAVVHSNRQNAEQMRKRGIFLNVAPSFLEEKSEHQTPSFIRSNNLNISPNEVLRETFAKSAETSRKKVSWWEHEEKEKWNTFPLHSNYVNYW